MNVFLFLASAVTALPAQAASPAIAPSKEAPTCYKRVYTAEHLRQNPSQKLDEMYVKLSWASEEDYEGKPYTWLTGEVVGTSKRQNYGNTAGCQIKKDGSVNCFIECDGGSFDLRRSPKFAGKVNFIVTKDYYFPLFKDRMSSDMERDVESISLDDDANRIYRLDPAPASTCDEAIRRIRPDELGGC